MDGKQIARVFQEPTGLYHVSDESLDYLDACGPGHATKAAALRAAWANGYTHAAGVWRTTKKIPHRYRTDALSA